MKLEVAGQGGIRITEAERNLQKAEIALLQRQVFSNPTISFSYTREGTGDKILLGGISIPLSIINRQQGWVVWKLPIPKEKNRFAAAAYHGE